MTPAGANTGVRGERNGMEKRYWFVAKTYVNKVGAHVSYFAYSDDAYGMHTTDNLDSENILYFLTEAEAKSFAYDGIANTDRTVHACYLAETPRRVYS